MFNPNQAFLLVQKLKSAPRASHQESRLKQKKIFSIWPKLLKLLINAELYAIVLASRLKKKRIPSNLRSQFTTLGTNVPAFIYYYAHIHVLGFISNLGPNKKPKMLKVGPKFFPAVTPQCKAGLTLSTITSGVSWWSSSNDLVNRFTISQAYLFFSFLSMVTYWVVIMSRLQTPGVTKCKSPQKGGLNTHDYLSAMDLVQLCPKKHKTKASQTRWPCQ